MNRKKRRDAPVESRAEQAGELNHRALGFWELLFQSISQISPIGAMIANMTVIAANAGPLMPMTFLFAAVAFLFLLVILVQFSRRIATAGGFYGYVRESLGARWGIRTGWLMILTYWMVVNFAVIFISAVLFPQTLDYFFGVSIPSWTWVPIALAVYAFTWGLSYASIKLSLRYSLITMALGIAVMAISGVGIILHAGAANDPGLFFDFGALRGTALSGVGVGVIFAMLSLGGASSAIYLAEETPTPKKTVTLAVVLSFGISLALFLLSSYALTIGWGPRNMAGFAKANIPGVALTNRALGPAMAGALVFFAFNASLTGILAPANAVVRIVYAMARDGAMVPRRFAYVHPKHGTPTKAILGLGVAGAAVGIAAGLAFGPFTGFEILAITATVAHFVCHILVNISLPVYSARRERLSILRHAVPAVIASGLILAAFSLILFPVHYPAVMGPVLVAAWWLAGEWRLRRSPGSDASALQTGAGP